MKNELVNSTEADRQDLGQLPSDDTRDDEDLTSTDGTVAVTQRQRGVTDQN